MAEEVSHVVCTVVFQTISTTSDEQLFFRYPSEFSARRFTKETITDQRIITLYNASVELTEVGEGSIPEEH